MLVTRIGVGARREVAAEIARGVVVLHESSQQPTVDLELLQTLTEPDHSIHVLQLCHVFSYLVVVLVELFDILHHFFNLFQVLHFQLACYPVL